MNNQTIFCMTKMHFKPGDFFNASYLTPIMSLLKIVSFVSMGKMKRSVLIFRFKRLPISFLVVRLFPMVRGKEVKRQEKLQQFRRWNVA